MKSTIQRLQEIQQHGFHIDVESTLREAFNNYKKIALTVGALIFILILPFTFVGIYIATKYNTQNVAELITKEFVSENSNLFIFLKFILSITGTSLLAPLTAGILKIAYNASRGNSFNILTAFSYYRTKYFKPLFIAALIITVVTSGIDSIANIIVVNGGLDDSSIFKSILALAIGMLTGIMGFLTIFTIPLIIFGDLPVKEAIEGSIMVVLKRFWSILALVLIGAFCSIIVGLMACCVGIFFTLPFMYSLQYTIFRNVIEIDDETDEIAQI